MSVTAALRRRSTQRTCLRAGANSEGMSDAASGKLDSFSNREYFVMMDIATPRAPDKTWNVHVARRQTKQDFEETAHDLASDFPSVSEERQFLCKLILGLAISRGSATAYLASADNHQHAHEGGHECREHGQSAAGATNAIRHPGNPAPCATRYGSRYAR